MELFKSSSGRERKYPDPRSRVSMQDEGEGEDEVEEETSYGLGMPNEDGDEDMDTGGKTHHQQKKHQQHSWMFKSSGVPHPDSISGGGSGTRYGGTSYGGRPHIQPGFARARDSETGEHKLFELRHGAEDEGTQQYKLLKNKQYSGSGSGNVAPRLAGSSQFKAFDYFLHKRPSAQPITFKRTDVIAQQAPVTVIVRLDADDYKARKMCNLPLKDVYAPLGDEYAHVIAPGDWLFSKVTPMAERNFRTFSEVVSGMPGVTVTRTVNGLAQSERLRYVGCAATVNLGVIAGKQNHSAALMQSTVTGVNSGPYDFQWGDICCFNETPYASVSPSTGEMIPMVKVEGTSPTAFLPTVFPLQTTSPLRMQGIIRRAIRAWEASIYTAVQALPNNTAAGFLGVFTNAVKDIDAKVVLDVSKDLSIPGHLVNHPILMHTRWRAVRHLMANPLLLSMALHHMAALGTENIFKPLHDYFEATLKPLEYSLTKYDSDALPIGKPDKSGEIAATNALTTAIAGANPEVKWFYQGPYEDLMTHVEQKEDLNLERIRLDVTEHVMGRVLNNSRSGHNLDLITTLSTR